ncbi:MAG: helix-turn-helix transcriptional regulator [Balneolaceae bacterium]|nr:helix-turn-helix transcriptional regulator [Balneolaceae bacterium]
MKIGINNMVCPRCIDAVEGIFKEMNLPASHIELGRVELENKLKADEIEELRSRLDKSGFELIFDRETELVNLVKSAMIRYLNHLESTSNPLKPSAFVTENTNYNYSYLSKVFSDQQGRTIESYLIELKIERVKELLSFNTFTLSEIAWKLKYSSVQYLSNQFKKVTGQTVSQYLALKKNQRKHLDTI